MQRTPRRHAVAAMAVVAATLTLVVVSRAPAEATVVQNGMDCGIGGAQTFRADMTAPATVARGAAFTVEVAPAGEPGTVSGAQIKDLRTTFSAPPGSSVVPGSAEIVPGTGSGTIGAASASISGSTVTLIVPGPIENGATFQNPTLRFQLQATGVAGTVLSVTLRQSAAYTLTAAGSFGVTCNANTPLTPLTATTITAPTTTTTTPPTSTTVPQSVVSYQTWAATGPCGAVQTTTAPPGTRAVTITASGAEGGRSGSQAGSATVAGGRGASAVGTFPATSGQPFAAVVGCDGADGGSFANTARPAGFSRGGGGGRGTVVAGRGGGSAGSGGGSSAVCASATCLATDFAAVPLVVAGSGGGGGVSNCAGTRSGPGGDGGVGAATGIAGGSGPSGGDGVSAKSPGGAGGVNATGGSQDGATSTDGSGGGGVNVAGGGGGAGYIGGGAGTKSQTGCSGAGGGGGGSSWVAGSSTATSFSTATSSGVTLRFEVVSAPLIAKPGVGGGVEGDTGQFVITVPLTLSAPSATPITVDFTTIDTGAAGVATAGVDYLATSGTVTFAPGETVAVVPVTVFGDTDDEPPLLYGEWIPIAFSNPSPGAVVDTGFFGLGLGIILDDDDS